MPRRRKEVAPKTEASKKRGPRSPVAAVQRQATALHPSRKPRAVVASRANPLKAGRRMDDMTEAELRAYARDVGVCRRDAEELSVQALKKNCQIRLVQIVDEL